VPLPAGVPATPTPLFDSLFGTCLTPEEGVRRDAFALRHMHLERYIPSTTFGMFDADYFPLVGLMPVTVKMKFNFVSADNAPGMLEWISRSMAGEDLSRFFWSDTEKADFKSAYIGRVSARWSAQHTMTSTKPCWDFRAIPLVTPVEVADDASAHYVTTVHKSPGPGIDYKSATNDPDVAHPERPATATLYQSDVREEPNFNSGSVATTERQRLESALAAAAASPVLFGNDSDVIAPAARPALTAFAAAARQKNPSDPLIPLKVDGFASLDGDATHNVDLSERRAVAVRSFLAGLGVTQPIGVLGHGPVGAAGDAANRRADISVDHAFETTYTSNRYSVGEHEFGHMLGLPDEYQNNTTGVLGAQQTLYSGLVTAAGVPGPAVWGVDTASQMSNGIDVLPRHYVTLWEALGRMTAPDIAQSEWSIS
jgi:outer membrane protein OmpA-like peptidoglycan-associated protein